MPVDESELNLEGTKERLYTFTYASAIIDAASAGNMAWLRETVINAAKAYDIDLNETEDRAKTKAAYKKAFQEDLAARGILIKTDTVGGYALSDDPEKRKEFSTLIYNVRCKKKEMELGRATMALVKRALKLKEGTLSFLAKELNLGPKTVQKIAINLLAVIVTFQALDKAKDNVLSEVRSNIARDILQLDDQEVVKGIFANRDKENELLNEMTEHGPEDVVGEFKFGSEVWKVAVKEAEKRFKEFTKIEGPTVVEAHLSDKHKEKLLNKSKAKFENEKEQNDGIVKRCADFMKDPIFFQAGVMMDAYLDIDKEVNPDGRVTFSVEKLGIGTRSAITKTGYLVPPLVSFANLANELVKDMTLGALSRLQLKLSSIVHKGYDSKSIDVRAVARFANQFLYGIDSVASILAQKIIPVGDFTKAEYDIRHFNIKEVDERKRGENYAKTYASLNIYRAGKAEYIVGAFTVFNMRPRDCLWAMAYLTAGINATKNGVIYDLPKGGKIGNKQEITEHHDKDLDKKTLMLYEKYESLALKIGYEAALQKMKDEFITVHHAAIDKSKKMREGMGLEPLSEISHFNRMYDNAPVKEYDYIRVKDVTKEEYQKNDLNKVFEEYDAIYIKDNYTGALQLNGEKKLVVASLDEQNRAVSMTCTPEIFNLETKEHNDIGKKKDTIEILEDTSKAILRNNALKSYQRTFDNKEVGERAASKWRMVTKDLFNTDGYVAVRDVKSNECGIKDKRTGIELKYTNCEPNVMLNDQCVSIKRFALDVLKAEREAICKTRGISEQDIKDVADITNNMTPATRCILMRIDKENRICSINNDLNLLMGGLNVEDTLVNMDKRREVVEHMTKLIGEFDKAEEIVDKLKSEIEQYNKLSKTDPVLALCKTVEPECERRGEFITLKLEDGTEFAMHQNGRLAEFCDELDDNICNLQHTFKKLLIEARNSGVDLSVVPGKGDKEIPDTEPVHDEEQVER